jgi:hypothetical protein
MTFDTKIGLASIGLYLVLLISAIVVIKLDDTRTDRKVQTITESFMRERHQPAQNMSCQTHQHSDFVWCSFPLNPSEADPTATPRLGWAVCLFDYGCFTHYR